MWIKVALGVVLLGSLSGCAAAHKTVLPDGRKGISLNCSGPLMTWNACYEKAGDACPSGYEIVAKDGDGGNGMAYGNRNGFGASSSNTRTLMVACKS